MNFMSTVKGSLLENFYPKGWDLNKIDECCNNLPEEIYDRQDYWNDEFDLVGCDSLDVFSTMMGHEIAMEIKNAKDNDQKIAFILPVGPMGMYKWAVYFLKEWNVSCSHVYGFNMDEWSDADGNTLEATNTGSFQYSMEKAFYEPLDDLTIPVDQRNFATKENLPTYPDKIRKLREEGARLVTVYGIGRACHIAFWEPHFADEFDTVEEWKRQEYRIGAKLHPLTIEQNALTSFKSRSTLVPCRANTIGPGLFLQSDRMIGGADGIFGRGMQWQGMSLWMTLRYGPDKSIPSTFVPTKPGKLFFMKPLAGPLMPEAN